MSVPHLVPVPVLYDNSTKTMAKRIMVQLHDSQPACLQECITKNERYRKYNLQYFTGTYKKKAYNAHLGRKNHFLGVSF
jgi:hypothetical protein